MTITLVHLTKICLLLVGLSVHQSKSDASRNGIIMNGANEPVDSANMADGSIDKNAVQQKSVDDDVTQHFPINSSIQQQQIDSDGSNRFDEYLTNFLAHHFAAEVVQPKDKKDNQNYEFRFTYPEARNVEVIIHLLDINPYANWLLINATSTAESQSHLNLTEHIEPSNVKSVIFNNTREISIRFQFTNSEWSRYRGFVLTIQPLVEISQYDLVSGKASDVPEPNNFDSDTNSIETLKLVIEVPKAKQINETWNLFRAILSNSTNKFINAEGINAEKCSADNVTLSNIHSCQTAWPNAQNCVKMDFSVRLNALPVAQKPSETNYRNNAGNVGNSTEMFEFNRDSLIDIWLKFGRDEFTDNGFKEFPVPEAGKLLFLWSIVSLSVIGVFLLILVSIWKMDIFRDYRRMYWKNSSDDEKQICKPSDMSMYPPVHQIVPTLFPNELSASNNTTNALPFEFITRPITFNASDFNRRPSLEESLKPSGNVKPKAGEVPFQSDSEFNESKQDRPEDEIHFNNSSSTSPRLVN